MIKISATLRPAASAVLIYITLTIYNMARCYCFHAEMHTDEVNRVEKH